MHKWLGLCCFQDYLGVLVSLVSGPAGCCCCSLHIHHPASGIHSFCFKIPPPCSWDNKDVAVLFKLLAVCLLSEGQRLYLHWSHKVCHSWASARFSGLVFQFGLNCLCVYFRQESWWHWYFPSWRPPSSLIEKLGRLSSCPCRLEERPNKIVTVILVSVHVTWTDTNGWETYLTYISKPNFPTLQPKKHVDQWISILWTHSYFPLILSIKKPLKVINRISPGRLQRLVFKV